MRHSLIVSAIVVCLLHAAAAPATAQHTHDAQLWVQTLALGRIGDWRTHLEVQPRVFDDGSELGLTVLRGAVGRALHPRVSAWLGYAWVPRTFGPGVRHEQRIWQQLLLAPPAFGGWVPQVRLRLEQRWQNEPWDGSSHRLRTLVRAQRPLDAGRRWQLAGYNELMVTFDETPDGPRQGYDRNRVYAGLMRTVAPALTVEGGYIWEHSPIDGPGDRHDHAAIVVMTLQWPRR
ncbi:MAG: DUF2490 domain-containing protein [Vicinamibacterales bacterium]